MEEHKRCPNYTDCPFYNKSYKICNKTSGIVGNRVAKCWTAYQRSKVLLSKSSRKDLNT